MFFWNKDWETNHFKYLQYEKTKDAKKASLGGDATELTNKYNHFKDLNPNEIDEVIAPAANLNITNRQYYEIYRNTKSAPITTNNSKPVKVNDELKKVGMTEGLYDAEFVSKSFDEYNESALFGGRVLVQTLLSGLNYVGEGFNRWFQNNISTPFSRHQEDVVREYGPKIGMTQEDMFEFEQKGDNVDQQDIKAFGLRAITAFKVLNDLGVTGPLPRGIAKIAPESNLAKFINAEINNVEAKNKSYLIAKGVTDENGNLYTTRSQMDVLSEIVGEEYQSLIRLKERGQQRDLTELEKIGIGLEAYGNIVGEEVNANDFLNLIMEPEALQANREDREGYTRAGIPANPGDFIMYFGTGNLHGRYSPQNVIYEDIKNTYDDKILEAEEAFRNNLINIDEKNNIVFNLENEKDAALSERGFEANNGVAGLFGGLINAYIWLQTDPFYALSKGVGVAGKAANNDVLAGIGKKMKEFIDDGGSLDDFWNQHDDVLRGLSNELDSMNKVEELPVFKRLIDSGFNHKFARQVVDAADSDSIYQLLKDAPAQGYVSDMVYGKQSIGKLGQYKIQSKVLSSKLLTAIRNKTIDGRRGGTFKEIIEGTDIRLPNDGAGIEIDLRDTQDAVVIFSRVSTLFKVPEARANKLLLDFQKAIDDGLYTKAQEIYYDGLLITEGSLQLRHLFGMTDDEIRLFWHGDKETKGALKRLKRGFDDTEGFKKPSRNEMFFDGDEVDILTQRQFGHQVNDLAGLKDFEDQSIELLSQFTGYGIEVPDVIKAIKATSQRRRLRAKVVIEKEGIDEVTAAARKAFDEGKSGTIYDPDTPIGKIINEIAPGVDDPSLLFKGQEAGLSAIEKGTFGYVRSLWYPLALLGRFSYPSKLVIDGNLRMSLLGVRSMFRGSPLNYIKLMMNDEAGLLSKIFGKPSTSLKGPWKKHPEDFKKFKKLEEKIPAWVRKKLNIFVDSAERGIPELDGVMSASPTFTFRKGHGDTGYYLVNKVGQKNVPTPEGEMLDFVLDDSYIEAYAEYLFQYIDDDLGMVVATLMRDGHDATSISKIIQETPSLRGIVEESNKMMLSRSKYHPGTIPIATGSDSYDKLARHYINTLNNYTGGHDEILEIIANGRVGKIGGRTTVDLRSVDSMSPNQYSRYYQKLKKLVGRYQDDLPSQIPKQKEVVEDVKSYQKFMNALFYATAQFEFNLARLPLIRQAYEWYLQSTIGFASKGALNDLLNAHLDDASNINLSDEMFELVQKEYDKVKDLVSDVSIVDRKVPIKVFDNGDSLSIIGYSENGQQSLTVLKRFNANKDSLDLDLDLYNTELKTFKTQRKVADYRVGEDSDAIGVYNFSINKSEAIIDGALPNKELLINTIADSFNTTTDTATKLVDEAIEYLAKTKGKFDLPTNQRELFELLGITGNDANLIKLERVLQSGKMAGKKETGKKQDVGISTIERVLGTKLSSRNLFRKKGSVDEKAEQVFNDIGAKSMSGEKGGSYDLGLDTFVEKPGLYVSPYGARENVVKGVLTKNVIKKYIEKNKSILSKENHYLGVWVDEKGATHLDITVRIDRGVGANVANASDEALAKAQYLGIMSKQKAIGNVSETGYEDILTMNNPDAFDVIRRAGQDLLNTSAQRRAFNPNKAITVSAVGKVRPYDILDKSGIRAIVNQKAGNVSILKPNSNPIMERVFSGDYQSMLDMNDIKTGLPRNMTMDDLHDRAWEYAFELHSRLLYNLTERGYFSQAYRIGFAFFEAWREVIGRYANLALANPKAVAQIGFGVRKGIEHNYIYEDKYGDKHLIVPVGGTPFEDLIKSEGRGMWTDDTEVDDSSIIAKRSFPLTGMLVGGGGLFPPVGPALMIPTGLLVSENPGGKRLLENWIFGGFELQFANVNSLEDLPAAIVNSTMPSVAKNTLNAAALNFGKKGLDEDMWFSSVNQGYQIAGLLRPDLSTDVEALEEVALQLATNYMQIKAWDRFINPMAPRLHVMYEIEGNEAVFREWYDESGADHGLMYNNFVEIAAIMGFYNDIKDEYVMKLGQQGEFYALLEISKLLGLDRHNLAEAFTSTALQIKGKNISEGGRLPRTTKEYDFVLDNPELAADYGPVITYFASGLDEGKVDYSGFGSIKNLGLMRPKTNDEFYFSVQTYLASIVEKGQKDYWSQVIDNSTTDPGERAAKKKAQFALIENETKKMFPMAYGSSAELNKVLGMDYEFGVPNDVMIDYFNRAVKDSRFKDFEMTDELTEYLGYRQTVIDKIQVEKLMPMEEDAVNWLMRNESPAAQAIREELFTKAQIIGRKNPKFLIVFEEVFSYELTKFGLGD